VTPRRAHHRNPPVPTRRQSAEPCRAGLGLADRCTGRTWTAASASTSAGTTGRSSQGTC